MNLDFCMFCGACGSKEHIIPKWINRQFEESSVFTGNYRYIYGYSITKDGFFEKVSRKNLNNFSTHRICRECNNGWMSSIENQISLLLKPVFLTDANDFIKKLDQNDCLLLSQWAWMKALCIAAISSKDPYVYFPKQFYEMFLNQIFPEGLMIELTSFKTFRFDFFVGGRPFESIKGKSNNVMGLDISFFFKRVTFRFGHFIFRISVLNPIFNFHRIQLPLPANRPQFKIIHSNNSPVRSCPNKSWSFKVLPKEEIRIAHDTLILFE